MRRVRISVLVVGSLFGLGTASARCAQIANLLSVAAPGPVMGIALPGIGTIDGKSEPRSIRLVAKESFGVTGSGFGAVRGTAFITSDRRDRGSCDIPGLKLSLDVVAWSENRLTLRMPDTLPLSAPEPCDAVLVVQNTGGELKHGATLAAATTLHSGSMVALPAAGVGTVSKPAAPMPTGVFGPAPPHGPVLGLTSSGPGIFGIGTNGEGYRVTPGIDYRISGSQFGQGVGRVRMVSPAIPNGAIDLIVEDWQDGSIRALIPKDVSGVIDINPVTLQVITASGRMFTKGDVSFTATRSPPTVFSTKNSNFASQLRLIADPRWPAQANVFPVYRFKTGNNIDCPGPGQDQVGVRLKNGWVATYVVVVPETSEFSDPNHMADGSNGDTVFTGAYQVNHSTPGLVFIDWGVFRNHEAKSFGGVSQAPDTCTSRYDLNVTAIGPVGTAPY